jgi:PAS domain-containing protein
MADQHWGGAMFERTHFSHNKGDAFNEDYLFYETDCQGVITSASKKFCDLSGYALDELDR